MATISTVTDRVDGEVLTAAKYNTDHGVHETNATNLNTGKVEISNYNTEHGPTGVHSEDIVRDSINLATGDSVRFGAVTSDRLELRTAAPATPLVKTLYEDSIIKAWAKANSSGATSDAMNISSITDVGVGNIRYNFAVPMSGIDYSAVPSYSSSTLVISKISDIQTTFVEVKTVSTIDVLTDPGDYHTIMVVGNN